MWIAIQNAVGARQGVGGGPGPTPPPYTPPLDSITAAVAYSVRKLNSTYSGDCMLVRRVSDGATQGIGFDSNGLIDVNALATFSGGSELTVKVWYDQAGGGFDLEQPNDAYLPTIYDGSAVTTSTSGKPCVRIVRVSNAGPGEWLQTDPVSLSTAGDMDVFLVLHGSLANSGDRRFWDSNAGPTTSGARFGLSYATGTYRADGQGVGLTTAVQITSGPVPANLQFIHNTRYYSNLEIYGNGVEFGSAVATNTSRTDPYNVALGARVGGAEGYDTFDISEIIHLPNYGVSNNESINLNINDYYQFTNLPYYSSGLLADYPGAAAAYSVRKLSNTAIKCMRVRRTVAPFDEQDIGFTDAGDLDETAISTFGGSDVLVVSRWYDQSGKSNHAVPNSSTAQPQIYNGTAVITENGKAALQFDGVDDLFDFPASYDPNFYYSVFTVRQSSTVTSIFLGSKDTNRYWADFGGNNDTTNSFLQDGFNGGSLTSDYAIYRKNGLPAFLTTTTRAQYGAAFYDGNQTLMSFLTDGTPFAINPGFTSLRIGGYTGGASPFNGTAQEVIMYQSTTGNQSSNATAIETNINTYYGIYTMYNPDAPTSGFLFDYSGAIVAYSVRQLNNNATYAMRVRRNVAPFDEQDIGFDGSGNLDTTALTTFGGSDPLVVSRWYDQSGSQRHATQITPNQPLIYNGTSVATVNGRPTLYNDGYGNMIFNATYTQPYSYTAVGRAGLFDRMLGNNQQWYQESSNTKVLGVDVDGGDDFRNDQVNIFAVGNGASSLGKVAGATSQPPALTFTKLDDFVFSSIGGRYTYNGSNSGEIQEVIFWTNDQENEGNRTAIESNINTYYSIY